MPLKPGEVQQTVFAEPSSWRRLTSRAFDPFKDSHLHQTKIIRCPRCRLKIEARGFGERVVSLLERNRYSLEDTRSAMESAMNGKSKKLINRICSAYTDGEIFSFDLIEAVMRQGSLIKKMYEMSWTSPQFFEGTTDEVSPFVPTLDIDLVWDTHQLTGPEYNADCKQYVGRYIDHDDKVEESALSNAFDATSHAWKERFNVPYVHCGCPIPGESVGRKVSFLRAILSQSTKTPAYDLIPPEHAGALSGTHPSDHNAVLLFHRPAGLATQQKPVEEFRSWQLREGKGKQGAGKHSGAVAHDPAFLVPVPMYLTHPEEVLCAAVPGNVITNPTGGVGGGQCVFGMV
ncbi:hypothetical protein H0H81_012733 [Sphagnurus paluster]|uniref:Uncharacterized protein n=1 Tax=Sphagnurus paluster TaxID=117069 RepID=A0A9P7KFH3_9AGAR|nr:hypothetical protein H0H81_012733 [Sphagnurus paluster]